MSLIRKSATELVGDMSSGALTAQDLMRATLDRISEVNGVVNAIVGMSDEKTLMQAARDKDAQGSSGPLHGLPIAVKDLVNVAGMPTTKGVPALADFVPQSDDMLAARMRAAGAILIGKTNTPPFGLGSHTVNRVYGATRNPYDLSLTCGGSSGGAAVALATGMTALADGSDMMGSLRNPAGWNNVYGFRPGWGVVPSEPVADTFLHQLATLGPMARSPQDIALLLDAIAGPDPRQPHAVPYSPIAPLEAASLKGVRIAWLRDWDGAFPMERGILDICGNAIRVLADLGAEIDEPEPPFDAEAMFQSWATLRSWQHGAAFDVLLRQGIELPKTAIWEYERARALSAFDVHRASVVRSNFFKAMAQLFDSHDAIVLPTAQMWPFSVDIDYPREIAGQAMDTYHRWMAVTLPSSLIGLPALAAPAGFGAAGLPMGIQIIGPRGSDARLLSIGAAYHDATRWPQERPAM